jgi:alpha-tubulin suppressor-like RCC1 family protein
MVSMTPSIRLSLITGAALIVGVSCQDGNNTPTYPVSIETDPALATAATTPLAFSVTSAGMWHSCGVATDSRAYCWGWNVHGQAGNGMTKYDQRTPTLVVGGLRF